jgi:tetratricopeptide (TPR) repeat protein
MNSQYDPEKTRKLGGTQPSPAVDDTQPVQTRPARKTSKASRLWLLAIPISIVFILIISVTTGYMQGMRTREVTSSETLASALEEQMNQGIEDLNAGKYELARQRFEYVLGVDPNYPGASELLAQALSALNEPTSTPSPEASPTPTETPDLGSYDGIYQSAQSAFAREDWTTALDLLLILRGKDPSFRLDEVNALMASSLRNRGMAKLFQTQLEQGVYDLTLAERFGPLDNQAISWRNSAQFYIFANSFFGLDPKLATEYFGQICQANIWGACRKYGVSSIEYAGRLVAAGEGDVCLISNLYGEGFTHAIDNAAAPTATKIARLCMTATAPTPTGTITLTPTFELFTATPTSTLLSASATPSPTGAGATATPTATSGPPPSPTSTNTPVPSNTPTETT